MEGLVAEVDLQVVGQEQHQTEHAGAGEKGGQERTAAVTVQDDVQGQQRVVGAAFDGDERDQQDRSNSQQDPGRSAGPAVFGGVREAPDQGDQAGGDQHGSGDVVAARPLGAAFSDGGDRGHGGGERDGGVDKQAPAPVRVLGEHTAGDESDGTSGALQGAVDAECLGALAAVSEGDRDQRQGGRREERGEGALQRASGEQRRTVGCDTGDHGGEGEADQSDHEDALAAHEVDDATAQQQQTAERQRVGGHRPLSVGVTDLQIGLSPGQRYVDDGSIEYHHQRRHRDHGQRRPAPRVERDARARRIGRCSHHCPIKV